MFISSFWASQSGGFDASEFDLLFLTWSVRPTQLFPVVWILFWDTSILGSAGGLLRNVSSLWHLDKLWHLASRPFCALTIDSRVSFGRADLEVRHRFEAVK